LKSVERQLVIGEFGEEQIHGRLKPKHADATGIPSRAECVRSLRAVDRDRIGCAIAAAGRTAKIESDVRHVGPAQVADDDIVGAPERSKVDFLHVIQVHRDACHVADEEHASAVGHDVDVLGNVCSEEPHRATTSNQRVVVRATVDRELDHAGGQRRGRDPVVAAKRVDHQ
jgi:hypothetical protein